MHEMSLKKSAKQWLFCLCLNGFQKSHMKRRGLFDVGFRKSCLHQTFAFCVSRWCVWSFPCTIPSKLAFTKRHFVFYLCSKYCVRAQNYLLCWRCVYGVFSMCLAVHYLCIIWVHIWFRVCLLWVYVVIVNIVNTLNTRLQHFIGTCWQKFWFAIWIESIMALWKTAAILFFTPRATLQFACFAKMAYDKSVISKLIFN